MLTSHRNRETKEPIFLVGCPRSGTTLLEQLLNAHPDVAIAPETHFIRRFWLQRKRYGDLTKEPNYHQLIADVVAMPEFTDMGLNAHDFQEAAWVNERDYSAIFRLLLKHFANTRRTQVIGEKTPNHLLYMSILQQFFPSARFIHIVRDPRAVVNSWRTVPWSTGTLGGDAEVWRRYMATARRYPPAGASLFTLSYEQLVLAPEDSLRAICHFLNLEFEPAMLAYYLNPSQTINVVREPWKSNTKNPLSQTSLTRWQAELSQSMVAEIEAVAWPEMRRVGYNAQTPLWHLLPAATPIVVQRNLKRIK